MALTPPPGVQKASVWKEWHLYALRMADIGHGKASKRLRYEMRLLRLRPCSRNVNYILTAEALHWLPTGNYDLVLVGPGFKYGAKKVLRVTAQNDAAPFAGAVVREGDGVWQVTPDAAAKGESWLELVVAGGTEGIEILLNGKPKALDAVCWASHRISRTNDGRRLLRIKIPPLTEPSTVSLATHSQSDKRAKEQQIAIVQYEKSVKPLEWVALKAKVSFRPVQVIWQFVDGDNRVGESIRYRWMVGTEAEAEVTAFDQYGVPWTAGMAQPLTMPLSRSQSSCAFAAFNSERPSLLKYLFQFSVESFVKLME